MSPAARSLAVLLGAVGMVVGMAALVREVVLAAEPGLSWPPPTWWDRLTAEPTWVTTAAAAGTAAAAVVLVVVAVRQLRGERARRQVLEFGGAEGQARLNVEALETALTRRVRAGLAGTAARRVTLRKEAGGWFASLEADVLARDLVGLQTRAFDLLGADLERLGGMRLDGVDLIVTGFASASPAKPAAKKEDLGMTRSS